MTRLCPIKPDDLAQACAPVFPHDTELAAGHGFARYPAGREALLSEYPDWCGESELGAATAGSHTRKPEGWGFWVKSSRKLMSHVCPTAPPPSENANGSSGNQPPLWSGTLFFNCSPCW